MPRQSHPEAPMALSREVAISATSAGTGSSRSVCVTERVPVLAFVRLEFRSRCERGQRLGRILLAAKLQQRRAQVVMCASVRWTEAYCNLEGIDSISLAFLAVA